MANTALVRLRGLYFIHSQRDGKTIHQLCHIFSLGRKRRGERALRRGGGGHPVGGGGAPSRGEGVRRRGVTQGRPGRSRHPTDLRGRLSARVPPPPRGACLGENNSARAQALARRLWHHRPFMAIGEARTLFVSAGSSPAHGESRPRRPGCRAVAPPRGHLPRARAPLSAPSASRRVSSSATWAHRVAGWTHGVAGSGTRGCMLGCRRPPRAAAA